MQSYSAEKTKVKARRDTEKDGPIIRRGDCASTRPRHARAAWFLAKVDLRRSGGMGPSSLPVEPAPYTL